MYEASENVLTWSSELFSERALRALNISTTTRTVMATVDGCRSLNTAQAASLLQCREPVTSLQLRPGPPCTRQVILYKK